MQKTLAIILTSIMLNPVSIFAECNDCCKDSIEILAYSKINGDGGMKLAARDNATSEWTPIGNGYTFVSSDFGPWGSHKKMFAPQLRQNDDGTWTATWIADVNGVVVASATSPDLIAWRPQTYGTDLKVRNKTQEHIVNGTIVTGTAVKAPRCIVKHLSNHVEKRKQISEKHGELMADDDKRFGDLDVLKYTVKAKPEAKKNISDKLIGIFFEDINYGADGGLYAELVQNRDFEYKPSDRGGDKEWNALTSWKINDDEKGSAEILTANPIHANNPHYLSITTTAPGYKIINNGYDGITLKKGETYLFSIFAKAKKPTQIEVSATSKDGEVKSSAIIKIEGNEWKKYETSLYPSTDIIDGKLMITIKGVTTLDIDMVSLFPERTFKGHKNGLREDLAQILADLKPKFVRFPGGCVAHGDGIDNIYDWKGSIGSLEARKPLRNLWNYHQTRGLGYFEYFQFCEDIGAEPLPVLAAGVPCQNSGTKAHHSHDALTSLGQQCGIPMEEMDDYIQDVLDLIEYANGSTETYWGSKRAEAGHPEPFNLKYIGIGNEDMITEVFVPRFTMIYNAVREKHPEVEVIGTVGPFYEGADYVAGWELADKLNIPYVDEHYYVQPGWMIYNQDYYDDYKRNATKVYLGEYAAHVPDRSSNMETALAEALYLTSVERNADVVAMTSYAPLLGKDKHMQWHPNLIYFDNNTVSPSTDYYVQWLYGNNSGTTYIPANTSLNTDCQKATVRVGSSIVIDDETGDCIIKLANLLPTEVKSDISLKGLGIKKGSKATVTTLSGNPQDKEVKPVENQTTLKSGKQLDYTMPPYSFTVIRIHKK